MLRRLLLAAAGFFVGYSVAYSVVDRVARGALQVPWRQVPAMVAERAWAVLRVRLAELVRSRLDEVRAALGEARPDGHEGAAELRAGARRGR